MKQAANISLRLQLSRQGYSAESVTQRVAALWKTKFDKEGTENDLTKAIFVHLRKCPDLKQKFLDSLCKDGDS